MGVQLFFKRPDKGWGWTGFLLLLLIFSRTDGTAQEEKDGELPQILSGLKDRFARVKTFQAEYVREIVPKVPSQLSGAALRAEGKLYFRSPHRLRLEQGKPRKEILILNGEKAFWYVPEEKTVTVYRLKDYYSQIQPILNLLSGLSGLEKDFSVRLEKETSPDAPYRVLILIPKTPLPDLRQISLKVSKKDFLPLECIYENVLGDGTRFRFDRIRTQTALADSLFVFTPPAGTRVVSQQPILPAK